MRCVCALAILCEIVVVYGNSEPEELGKRDGMADSVFFPWSAADTTPYPWEKQLEMLRSISDHSKAFENRMQGGVATPILPQAPTEVSGFTALHVVVKLILGVTAIYYLVRLALRRCRRSRAPVEDIVPTQIYVDSVGTRIRDPEMARRSTSYFNPPSRRTNC